jgi:hypothetical protein
MNLFLLLSAIDILTIFGATVASLTFPKVFVGEVL